MAACSIELKSKRDLLCPDFEGYKLSLDKLPQYSTKIENGVYNVTLSDDQFSYHHARLLGVQNQIFADPWNLECVYLIDSQWNVIKASGHDTSVNCSPASFTIPDASNQQLVPGHTGARLQFISEDMALVCDGAGQVYILQTQQRSNNGNVKWKILMSCTVPDEKIPCILLDAIIYSNNENHNIDCVLAHVVESTPEQKDKYRSQYLTMLEWITFTSVDKTSWNVDRTRQLLSRKPCSYVSLERNGQSISIAGEAEFIFVRDSEIPVVSDEEKEDEKKVNIDQPDYTWHQTDEDISVQFTVSEGVTKGDIYLTTKFNYIDFGLKNKSELLKGTLCGEVDTDSCTWTIEGRRVDLFLTKKSDGRWPLVVEGDTRGEMLMNPSEVSAIHERLATLTSGDMNVDPEKQDKPYNTQQLEECDMYPDDDTSLVRLDGNTHNVTHRIGLGSHQWLYSVNMEQNASPAICLRHDVDGLLWKLEADNNWSHVATFNAFGYVQASKEQRKFSTSPPDNSYAVICEGSHRIYVYRQSIPVSTPLRNRKTGQQVKAVSKQQVISLDNTDSILGVHATNDKLFVCTVDYLYMIKIQG
ncbi:NudC domain-containing protein 1 [Mactra antiquata]